MTDPAKINYCDKDAECTAAPGMQEQCRHFQCESEPHTYCDHLTWWGGCMCEAAVEGGKGLINLHKINFCDQDGKCTITDMEPFDQCCFYKKSQAYGLCFNHTWNHGCASDEAQKNAQRDGAVAAHQAHNLVHEGSIPSPATKHEGGKAGGSGER